MIQCKKCFQSLLHKEMKRVTLVCMFLSCHVRISEWIYTPYLPECQGTPCSKQARYLKFKWLQLDSNPQLLSSWIIVNISTFCWRTWQNVSDYKTRLLSNIRFFVFFIKCIFLESASSFFVLFFFIFIRHFCSQRVDELWKTKNGLL